MVFHGVIVSLLYFECQHGDLLGIVSWIYHICGVSSGPQRSTTGSCLSIWIRLVVGLHSRNPYRAGSGCFHCQVGPLDCHAYSRLSDKLLKFCILMNLIVLAVFHLSKFSLIFGITAYSCRSQAGSWFGRCLHTLGIIIPTDGLICFKGEAQPPTRLLLVHGKHDDEPLDFAFRLWWLWITILDELIPDATWRAKARRCWKRSSNCISSYWVSRPRRFL